MKTLLFLRRDFKLGLINRSYMFAIAIIFSFVSAYQCSDAMSGIKELNFMWTNGTIVDYYLFAMKGMEFYRFDPVASFQIPLLWFVFQIGISYIIAYYAEKDFTDNGVNVMLAGRSRASWWLSKMLWCILSVLFYYVVAILSCIVFALFHGAEFSLGVTDEFIKFIFGYNMSYVSSTDLIIIALLIPVLITIGICLVQLLLSFILSPVTSFAITSGLYVLSAYYTAWFLPGSFTMWVRSSYYHEQGINPLSGLIIACFMVIAVYLMGKRYFERKDIT
ncbi:hypothetical protein B0O40_1520 [Ruminococcaceae bacterium R-25]|nr:hypothetical protein B0O40_1520 [Ruminococcaceae bacterium R-25]SUQ21386.1 hypothetical protein SAMN06297423_1520 [Oscillospiraceae bacterium]